MVNKATPPPNFNPSSFSADVEKIRGSDLAQRPSASMKRQVVEAAIPSIKRLAEENPDLLISRLAKVIEKKARDAGAGNRFRLTPSELSKIYRQLTGEYITRRSQESKDNFSRLKSERKKAEASTTDEPLPTAAPATVMDPVVAPVEPPAPPTGKAPPSHDFD